MGDVKFCGECGAKLKKSDAKACMKCGSDPSKPTKFCTACGTAKASENAVVCVNCGSTLKKVSSEKDPAIAALIAVVCMFVLGAPSIGYMYLGNVRKGIIYLLAGWALAIVVVVAYLIGAYGTLGVGAVCCLPAFLVPIAFELLIVYDVYLEARGEKTKLPDF
jgi:uncharacterized membrane protein YvbJ